MISKTEVGSCPHVNLRVMIVCVNQFCLLNRYLGVALETLSFFFLAPSQVLELLDKIYICNMVLKIISYNIANVKCSCYVSYVIVCVRRNKNRFYLVTKRNALKLIYVNITFCHS